MIFDFCKLDDTNQNLTDLPPLITKSGVRHPGLVNSNGVKRFQSPIVNRLLEGQGKLTNQMKRRSDISHEILRAKNIEEEDSILLNQDLETLCKGAKTNSSLTSSNVLSSAKRSKLD